MAMALIDERRSLPRKGRLLVQLGVVLALVLLAPLHVPAVPFWLSVPLALIWIVWSLNAYNFMDGLNGISSATAIVTGATLGWLAFARGDQPAAYLALASAAAAAGFLPFNLPSGSIFMGDTGSATLGFLFGVLVLRVSHDLASLVACVLPLAPFFLDASITIVRRMLRGERFFSTPHRSHFYQRLQQKGWSHAQVTGLYAALALVGAALALAFSSLSTPVAIGATVGFVALHAIVFSCIETAWRRSQSTPG
jgi:UDP-N-acetylmuramyl pentapeptide phosphotransferase/UDP-N-acetylglucosamine-1-phosphate transferase